MSKTANGRYEHVGWQLANGTRWVVAIMILIALPACEENIRYTQSVKWDKLVVMSAVPVVQTNEGGVKRYEPVCGATSPGSGDADGLALKVLFLGSQKKEGEDRDASIQPGDHVESSMVTPEGTTPSLFELSFDCMDRLPDESPTTCESGLATGSPQVDSIDFYAYEQNGSAGDVGVLFVLDLSGSMQGLVNPFAPYQYKEDTYDSIAQKLPGGLNFQQNGTDPAGERFKALQDAIEQSLNAEDSILVVAFNENSFKVVCEIPGYVDQDPDLMMNECYGKNRSLFLGHEGVEAEIGELVKLQGKERGRTPLWYAVNRAYDFMREQDQTFRHIVVIGDGPDTCSESAELNHCSGPCTQFRTEFEEFRGNILSEGLEDRVPIHFVQLGAKGYPDRDPRQQEVACLTGGQHIFINATQIPSNKLRNVIESRLRNLMYTVRGYWQFNVELSAMSQMNDPPNGGLYAIDGMGQVLPGMNGLLVAQDEVFSFKFGEENTTLDGRVAVRKPCDPDNDHCGEMAGCSGDAEQCASSCRIPISWCDEETLTCLQGFEYEHNGSTSDCGDEKAKILIEIKVEGQPTELKEVYLGDLPTLCCGGNCVPPDPPEIPTDFSYPPNSSQVCFHYDEIVGWQRAFPEDPTSTWVYYGELNQGAGPDCSWSKLKEHLEYDGGDFEFDQDWTCAGSNDNCYPPPGLVAEEGPR
jgi:hypothetical protein